MNSRKTNRREFLGRAGLGIAASTVGVPLLGQAVSAPPPAAAAGEMPCRTSEVTAFLARTAPVAARGEFEPFKTSNQFDGTGHNPQWPG